jgi:hypothetical protein
VRSVYMEEGGDAIGDEIEKVGEGEGEGEGEEVFQLPACGSPKKTIFPPTSSNNFIVSLK